MKRYEIYIIYSIYIDNVLRKIQKKGLKKIGSWNKKKEQACADDEAAGCSRTSWKSSV